MKFNEWKTLAMHRLVTIYDKYRDNVKAAADIDFLILKLKELRARDLGNFLAYVHMVKKAHNIPELRDIIPGAEEIKQMLEED
jgi:uncharacterized membrane protein